MVFPSAKVIFFVLSKADTGVVHFFPSRWYISFRYGWYIYSALINNSRNFVWFYTYKAYDNIEWLIYNSRNIVWFYTPGAGTPRGEGIYNSRNFVWFYTFNDLIFVSINIYNSRNFVWFYT